MKIPFGFNEGRKVSECVKSGVRSWSAQDQGVSHATRCLVEFARQLVFNRPDLNDTIMNSLDVAQSRIVSGANEGCECDRAKQEMDQIAHP